MSQPDVSGSILARTAKGAGWIIAWRMLTRILGTVSTLMLVRFLLPADFGVVALGVNFMQAVESLGFVGVEEALIREKAPERDLYDTGFTLNVLRGLAMALVLAGAAIPAGGFFGDPRLANVLLALALGTLIEGATNIGTVDFRRDFAFHRELLLLILPRLASIALMVGMAVLWQTYWALVAGILSMRVLKVAMSYRMHPYRPRLTLRARRALLGYSLWTWAVSMAAVARERSNALLIGRMLDPMRVGVFSVGADLASLPTTELVVPLSRAAFSGFSAARHTGESMAETYLRVVSSTALLTLPMGIGLSLVADPLVRLAFGDAWLDAVPVVRILGLSGAAAVFDYIGWTLFFAHAQLSTVFRVTCLSAVVRVLLLLVLLPHFGLIGAAVATLVSVSAEAVCYLGLIFHHLDLSPGALLRRIWRCLLASAVMVLALVPAGLGWVAVPAPPAELALHLLEAVLAGALAYSATLLLAWYCSGRPAGAEADALGAAKKLWRRIGGSGRPPYSAG
jgi:O-antigen/teichoic acid export membrane protein